MLLIVDKSIKEFIEKNDSSLSCTSKVLRNINKLADAHIDFKHIVLSDIDTLTFLSQYKKISAHSNEVFLRILKQYYEYGNYENYFETKLIVHMNKKDAINTNRVFYKRLDKITDLNSSVLIGENLSDVTFYKHLYDNIQRDLPFDISFNVDHSGGSCGYETVKNKMLSENLCFCVFDTDKSFDSDTEKESYKNARKAIDELSSTHVGFLFHMNLREKENWLPIQLYILNHYDKKELEVLDILRKMSLKKKFFEFIAYFDFKDGIKVKNIKRVFTGSCQNVQKAYRILDRLGFIDIESILNGTLDDDETVFSAFGENTTKCTINEFFLGGIDRKVKKIETLVDVNDQQKNRIRQKLLDRKNIYRHSFNFPGEYLQEEWNRLCKLFSEWGCCHNKDTMRLYT